ncbi:MAG: hypothetical protein ACXAC5_02010 [Promethearchaeota archaeon]|jgi:hypothetical protein
MVTIVTGFSLMLVAGVFFLVFWKVSGNGKHSEARVFAAIISLLVAFLGLLMVAGGAKDYEDCDMQCLTLIRSV